MSIQALPQNTVRTIGASQVLTDPASVVKELIDNALDARATSIFVEISANTLDVIQVKDNGHGIGPEDRSMVAKRYCTSKIRNEDDLARIGGTSLGFRGEALSSAAEMSSSMSITTRVEGEEVAYLLKLRQDGELESSSPTSHPPGTTVRITDFLKQHPVRKQVALKNTAKCISKIKHLLQCYAFVRAATRLSLRILKQPNNKDNWTFAPKASVTSIEDTAMKIVGKMCASQCVAVTLDHESFTLHALLPKQDADTSKISNIGQFLSIDNRPVSTMRGTPKQIVKIFKDRLKSFGSPLDGVKDSFLYLDITCPLGSYDPNIEPAKDDVLFEDPQTVLDVTKRLFEPAYPGKGPDAIEVVSAAPVVSELDDIEMNQSGNHCDDKRMPRASSVLSNRYDHDDRDLGHDRASLLESEIDTAGLPDDPRSAQVSNPWIMAKVNTLKRRSNGIPQRNDQLLTPAKHLESPRVSSSPVRCAPPRVFSGALPSPKDSSPVRASQLDDMQYTGSPLNRFPPTFPPHPYMLGEPSSALELDESYNRTPEDNRGSSEFTTTCPQREGFMTSDFSSPNPKQTQGTPLHLIPDAPRQQPKGRRPVAQPSANKPFVPQIPKERDAWFNIPEMHQPQRPKRNVRPAYSYASWPPEYIRHELGNLTEPAQLLSPPKRNRDIRAFMGQRNQAALQHESVSGSGTTTVSDQEDMLLQPSRHPCTRPGSRAFVPASELDLDATGIENRTPVQSKPLRRRSDDRPPLIETSGNPKVGDQESHDQGPPKRRCTTAGGPQKTQRTKSSQWPLESVPPYVHMHDVVSTSVLTVQDLERTQEELIQQGGLLDWNEPALQPFDTFAMTTNDAEMARWITRLHDALTRHFPDLEMVLDLGNVVREALARA